MLKYSTRIIIPHGSTTVTKTPTKTSELDLDEQASQNEDKLVSTMKELLVKNSRGIGQASLAIETKPSTAQQFQRFSNSFSNYKSRKPKTFKL